MSGFFEIEAEESEEEEEEYDENEKKKLKMMKKKSHIQDSSEEEDEDEEDEENNDFINDNEEEEEEEGGSDSEVEGKKRKRRDDDDDDLEADNLDEDDLDLIEENIGVKLDRKKKFKRLKRIQDDDSDADNEDIQDRIRNEIFEHSGDEDEDGASQAHPPQQPETYPSDEEEEGEYDDEIFIVDEEGKPYARQKKKPVFDDEGLEAARDIFGCDFDYGEFEQYEDWEEEEDDDEGEDDEYEEDDDGEARERRRSRKERRKQVKKSIYEVFEPSELERGHLTDQDHEIRKLDMPERFQLRQIPVTRTRGEADDRTTDKELDLEAKWIYHHAFFRPFISNQEGREEARMRSRRDINMIQKIYNALDLMRNSTCEVPFIAFYRKEEVQPELNIHDLWKVYQWDEKWCQLKNRKENLRTRFQMMAEYQGDLIMKDLDAPLPENMRMLKEEDMERIEEIETSEQFNDYYKQFLLYYGKDQPAMRDHMKARRRERQPTTRIVKVMRKVRRKKKKKKNLIIEDDDEEEEAKKKKVPTATLR